MNIHYIKQILVKQGKFPLYIAQYILNFIIFEEIKLVQVLENKLYKCINRINQKA